MKILITIKKIGKDTVFSIYREDAQGVKLDDIIGANKFFFFHPFHLKIFMKKMKKMISSLNNNPRNISIYLYRPYKNTVEDLDSIKILHKEAFVAYTFIFPYNTEIQIPQFVIYSNYDTGHSLNEYSISL